MLQRALGPAGLRARPAAADRSDGSRPGRSEAGFSLVELVIVIGVMPLVIGAIAVGIISVFSLQGSVSNRLTDSGDAQVVSVNFQNDVQSAALMTTSDTAQNPAQCGTGFQILGLQLGNKNQISYTTAATSGGSPTYQLTRNVCTGGSQTPSSSSVITRDLPASVVTTSPVTLPQCPPPTSSTAAACNPGPGGTYAYQNGWVSTVGVTGITFQVKAPGSKFSYQLTAVPAAGANSTNLAPVAESIDWLRLCDTCDGHLRVNPVLRELRTLESTANRGHGCELSEREARDVGRHREHPLHSVVLHERQRHRPGRGHHRPNECGGGMSAYAARNGYNDITASPLPTYACPPTSEAFLGNNGFYTGVPGDPALYEVVQGSTAVISITNIQVLNSNGQPATNWELVTGGTRSRPTRASRSPGHRIKSSASSRTRRNSAVGNACNQTPGQATNTTYLFGLGTTTVKCTTTNSTDKTGTVMLQAKTPSQLTVTLVGTGLQAMFLGVLLP